MLHWSESLAADHPSVQMIDRIAKRVAETSQGRVTIQAFAASAAAGAAGRERLEKCRQRYPADDDREPGPDQPTSCRRSA